MYRIVRKEALRPTVTLYEIEAPLVAKKAQPGQFIILRVDDNGERIPITIHDYDPEKGTVTIIVQTVGATTEKLSHMNEGDSLRDFVGPLGKATETEGKKKVCVVGGGRRLRHRVPGAQEVPRLRRRGPRGHRLQEQGPGDPGGQVPRGQAAS